MQDLYKEGYLTFEGLKIYCALRYGFHGMLDWFEQPRTTHLKTMILLGSRITSRDACAISIYELSQSGRFSDGEYVLLADSPADRDAWLDVLLYHSEPLPVNPHPDVLATTDFETLPADLHQCLKDMKSCSSNDGLDEQDRNTLCGNLESTWEEWWLNCSSTRWTTNRMNTGEPISLVTRTARILHRRPTAFLSFCQTLTVTEQLTVSCSIVNNEIDVLVVCHHVKRALGYPWKAYSISVPSCNDDYFKLPRLITDRDIVTLLAVKNVGEHFMTSSNRWIRATIEILFCEFSMVSDICPLDTVQRVRCRLMLQKLVRMVGVLPSSFYLQDVARVGTYAISGGGFSDIWKGLLRGKSVCLKVLRIFVAESIRDDVVKDFCQEALVWRQLNHKNILPFLGVNVNLFAPSFCLILPWMDNGNIMSYLDKNNSGTQQRELAVLDIANGLDYLHSRSPPIIHGDIRGANVLVDVDGSCCIADFGLAIVAESRTLTDTSSSGHVRGSTRWMAPELLEIGRKSQANHTPRDVYAFGCTMLEILTGKPPFYEIRHEIAVTLNVIRGIRPERPPGADVIRDGLWTIIYHCWAHEPSERLVAKDVLLHLNFIHGKADALPPLPSIPLPPPPLPPPLPSSATGSTPNPKKLELVPVTAETTGSSSDVKDVPQSDVATHSKAEIPREPKVLAGSAYTHRRPRRKVSRRPSKARKLN